MAKARGTHGSPELDEDACKLEAMGADPGPTFQELAFDLIVGFRGGVPEKCDFCEQPFTQKRYPIPEEAGEWACSDCYARWSKEGLSHHDNR